MNHGHCLQINSPVSAAAAATVVLFPPSCSTILPRSTIIEEMEGDFGSPMATPAQRIERDRLSTLRACSLLGIEPRRTNIDENFASAEAALFAEPPAAPALSGPTPSKFGLRRKLAELTGRRHTMDPSQFKATPSKLNAMAAPPPPPLQQLQPMSTPRAPSFSSSSSEVFPPTNLLFLSPPPPLSSFFFPLSRICVWQTPRERSQTLSSPGDSSRNKMVSQDVTGMASFFFLSFLPLIPNPRSFKTISC